jgi:hypothetical protein
VGRREKSSAEYRQELAASVKEHSAQTWNEEIWPQLAAKFTTRSAICAMPRAIPPSKKPLKPAPANRAAARIISLPGCSAAPFCFHCRKSEPQWHGCRRSGTGLAQDHDRKPFGYDLASAVSLTPPSVLLSMKIISTGSTITSAKK